MVGSLDWVCSNSPFAASALSSSPLSLPTYVDSDLLRRSAALAQWHMMQPLAHQYSTSWNKSRMHKKTDSDRPEPTTLPRTMWNKEAIKIKHSSVHPCLHKSGTYITYAIQDLSGFAASTPPQHGCLVANLLKEVCKISRPRVSLGANGLGFICGNLTTEAGCLPSSFMRLQNSQGP